jgi:hypothetical protein
MRALLLTAALTVAPTLAFAEEWWVIVGYFDHPPLEWDDGILAQGRDLEAALAACDLKVYWDFAGKFEGLNTDGRGTVFVVDAPDLLTEQSAATLVEAAKPCVPDAYAKAARYYGE